MMKKLLYGLLALMLMGLCACAAPEPESLDSTENTLGIILEARDVTADGMTLLVRQTGVEVEGELNTGSPYVLQVWNGKDWEDVPTVIAEYGWTMEAYILEPDGEREFPINWEWLYGELEPGSYRLGKTFSDWTAPGDSRDETIYVQFTLE